MFEVIATTHLDHIDQLEHVFDLNVAPPEMVRALGRWIGVDLLDPGLDETAARCAHRDGAAGADCRAPIAV